MIYLKFNIELREELQCFKPRTDPNFPKKNNKYNKDKWVPFHYPIVYLFNASSSIMEL